MLISLVATFTMMTQSQPGDEPTNLAELMNYPGFAGESRDWTPGEIETEIVQMDLTGTVKGIPVPGLLEIRDELASKGYMSSGLYHIDSFFDVFVDVQVWSPDGLNSLHGVAFKGWTIEMQPDGTKVMITGCALQDNTTIPPTNYSMIMAVPTNVLPPEQMPGIDPYIIWNAEPYFYIQHMWWVYDPVWYPVGKLVYWKYWWYDSHKAPNWFWGPYWWWRTYISDYVGPYHWWYWWWWRWYYWRGWYFWSVHWPYY
jgi:hypothetical protein